MQLTVTQLNIYPIKSLAGIALAKSKVEARGLQYDRRWMLIDEQNLFISQRKFPEMALLQPSIAVDTMTIHHRNDRVPPFSFKLSETSGESIAVTTWDDTCPALEVSVAASVWFSEVLGTSCKLVQMPEDSVRPADPRYAISEDDKVSFADGYPILMFDEASIELLAEKSGVAIPLNRFRGNIIFKGGSAHIEDELKVFEINGLTYHGVKPCARCIMTTIDQEKGQTAGKEPLKTLATYRKVGHKILFGQNLIPAGKGSIAVGDTIHIKEMTEPIAF
ncbi:MAG: MOSC domain-containing protein [Roseivirga sp.]|nr:MOSC domain-containing protein [Roseivirga sp.]